MAKLSAPCFQDEAEAIKQLEAIRWPHGPVCPPKSIKMVKAGNKVNSLKLWRRCEDAN